MKHRHLISLLVTVLLIAVTVFPAGSALAAADVTSLAVTTDQEMRITTDAGDLISPDASGKYTNVPKDAKLYVEYAFSLPDYNEALDPEDPAYDYNYYAGDYIDVQLPYVVAFDEPTGGWDVKDDHGNTVGVLSIDADGLARIVFTAFVESHSSITGWFSLEGTFKDGIFDAGDPVQIEVTFAGTTVEIGFHDDREPLSVSADKNGVYDPDTNRITWTVTVTPNRNLDGVTIVDTFGNNQTYVAGSFKRGAGAIDDSALTIAPGTSTTQITYAGVSLNSGDTVFSYQTEPTATAFAAETGSVESVNFTNGVDVYLDDDPVADDDATVSLNWIQKSSSDVGTSLTDSRLIRWTIAVNAGGYDLSGATITDTIPKDLDLFVDSTHPIRFGSTDLTNDESHGPNTYTLAGASDTDILTVYLGDITATGSLVFYTRVTNDALYTGNGTTTFTNNAEFNWIGNVSGTPSDRDNEDVGQGVLSKAAGSTVNFDDDTNNIINWTVTVNRNLIDITNAIFSDTINAGQEYVADSFSINDTEGVFSYNPATHTLQYDFGTARVISNMYTIRFQTRITDYSPLYVNQANLAAYQNSATLTGTGILGGTVTTTGTQRYNSQVVNKTVQSGYDHTTKRVTWQIVVNRNDIPLTGATLTDTIPAGMTFLPETFSISGVTGAADDALSYTVNAPDDITSNDSFTYSFPAGFNETATITYQTQVKEDMLLTQGSKNFSNVARLTADGLDASSTAVASMSNTMVYKSMDYITGADYALWKVVINGEGVAMTNISVSDVLQAGLQLDLDSVTVYPMTLTADGTLTKVSTPISKDLFTVSYNATTRELVFGMPGTINSPYQLEFITDIMTSPLAISNTVTLSGSSYTATSIVNNVTINVGETGLGGSGVQGSITVEKVGESEEPLSGAVFTLYNNRGEMVAQDETDETGSVTFGGLPIRSYVLEETTAPEGYVRSEETVRFRMDTDVPNVFYDFANGKIRADVIVLKTGTDDVPLSGAEFTVYDADGHAVDVKTTGEDGKATFEDLEYGDYTIVETKVPEGYLRDAESTPVSVTTTDDVNVTITNTLIRADAIVHKTDRYGTPLAGAEFSLYDSDNHLIDTKTTGADGIAAFENLPYGAYTVVETKAPAGYVRTENATPFVIASTEDVNVTITNSPYEIPQTGGWLDTWMLLGLGGALALAGMVWLIVRRRVHAR